jgi:plasmanylethanolamine desaturase
MFPQVIFDVLSVLVQVILLISLADVFTGLFHWAEDTWGTEDTPIWGPVFVRQNLSHHSDPAAMLRKHWLPNNGLAFAVVALIILVAWSLDALSWQLLLLTVAAGLGQQAHRFAHAPRQKLPAVIRFLQRIHVMQRAQQHWQHHKWPHKVSYCTLTTWVNPILDGLGFWRGLERLLSPVFGPVRSEPAPR